LPLKDLNSDGAVLSENKDSMHACPGHVGPRSNLCYTLRYSLHSQSRP
jgi:hypothetical protein